MKTATLQRDIQRQLEEIGARIKALQEPASIKYPLTTKQQEIKKAFESHRFGIWIGGRRSGKTFLIADLVLSAAKRNPGLENLIVYPTIGQARAVFVDDMLGNTIPDAVIKEFNKTDRVITMYNGSKIRIAGAENIRRYRGKKFGLILFDEYRDCDPDAFRQHLRPTISDYKAPAYFFTSANGFDHGFDMYQKAGSDPAWARFITTTLECGIIDEEELEQARRDVPLDFFRQEYESAFISLEGQVYCNFSMTDNVRADLVDRRTQDLHIGWDFNVKPMVAYGMIKRGDEIHVLHEFIIENTTTQGMAQRIFEEHAVEIDWEKEPAPDNFAGQEIHWEMIAKDRGRTRRKLIAHPDPSGGSRTTKGSSTDFEMIRAAGIDVDMPYKHIPIRDRVNVVNALFCDASGRKRLFIHPRCVQLIRALNNQTWHNNLPDKGKWDHYVDALGYGVFVEARGQSRRMRQGEL